MNILSLLFQEPWLFLVIVLSFLMTLSVHEFSHALVGTWLGDNTAKRANRLTLNPMAHVDIFGFLTLITVGFGWGKPVPFNPYQLRYPRWGPSLVALAGPTSNLLMGILFSVLLALFGERLGPNNLLANFIGFSAYLNFGLMFFNLIPLAPLDGSKPLLALLDRHGQRGLHQLIEVQGPMLLLVIVLIDAVLGVGLFGWISTASRFLVSSIAQMLL